LCPQARLANELPGHGGIGGESSLVELALISEIIDEWLVVQRKWLYLEGIFIGGDIRTQLPEEARKFDDIDKSYRRVSNPKLFPCSGYLVIGLFGCLAPKAADLVSGYNLFGLI